MIRDVKYAKYVMDNELEGKIIKIDEGFTAITGYSWADVSAKNMTIFDLLPEEQRQEYIETVYGAAEAGEAFLNHGIKCKDGTVITVNCYGEVYDDTETGHACSKILITDVTKQEHAVKELTNKEEQLQLYIEKNKFLTENAQEIFIDYDRERDYLEISRFVNGEYEIFHSVENYVNSSYDTVYDDDFDRLKDILNSANDKRKSVFDFRSKLFTGSYVWYRLVYARYDNPQTGRNHVIGRLMDINEEKLVSLNLEKGTRQDVLTGVYNSKSTEAKIDEILAGSKAKVRHATYVVNIDKLNNLQAMLVVDIDKLGQINDEFGYEKGNQVLKKTGEILCNVFRQDFDIIGRIYGDVFVVLVRNVTETVYVEERCNEICRRIKEELSQEIFNEKNKVKVSIGIALSDEKSNTFKKFFAKALKALQKQKELGGDGVGF